MTSNEMEILIKAQVKLSIQRAIAAGSETVGEDKIAEILRAELNRLQSREPRKLPCGCSFCAMLADKLKNGEASQIGELEAEESRHLEKYGYAVGAPDMMSACPKCGRSQAIEKRQCEVNQEMYEAVRRAGLSELMRGRTEAESSEPRGTECPLCKSANILLRYLEG